MFLNDSVNVSPGFEHTFSRERVTLHFVIVTVISAKRCGSAFGEKLLQSLPVLA